MSKFVWVIVDRGTMVIKMSERSHALAIFETRAAARRQARLLSHVSAIRAEVKKA